MAGQTWAVSSEGGYLYSDQLSSELRRIAQPLERYRQFCDADDASSKGLKTGDKYHWNVIGNVATQGTTLSETSTVPMTSFTITQGTLTVNEMANGIPYTGKLDNLSLLPVKKIIQTALADDCNKALDLAAYDQFNATPLRFVATTDSTTGTLYTNSSATGTNSVNITKDHVKVIVDLMKERNIPAYSDMDYACVGHPTTFRRLKNDLESLHQYVDRGFQMILNGEIGRYEGVRFFEQNAVAKAAWTNGKSNQAHFFGKDTVMEAIVVPEEMRGKIPTNFGLSKGIAWYYLGGFGIVRTAAADARIVKWDSQA